MRKAEVKNGAGYPQVDREAKRHQEVQACTDIVQSVGNLFQPGTIYANVLHEDNGVYYTIKFRRGVSVEIEARRESVTEKGKVTTSKNHSDLPLKFTSSAKDYALFGLRAHEDVERLVTDFGRAYGALPKTPQE